MTEILSEADIAQTLVQTNTVVWVNAASINWNVATSTRTGATIHCSKNGHMAIFELEKAEPDRTK